MDEVYYCTDCYGDIWAILYEKIRCLKCGKEYDMPKMKSPHDWNKEQELLKKEK